MISGVSEVSENRLGKEALETVTKLPLALRHSTIANTDITDDATACVAKVWKS